MAEEEEVEVVDPKPILEEGIIVCNPRMCRNSSLPWV
jgi:hypothetical protein